MLSVSVGFCYGAAMPHAMTPSFGARFELNRRCVDAQDAVYDVTVFLPTSSQQYTLRIAQTDGQCQLLAASGTPESALPDWVHKHLLSLARGVFRAAKRQGPEGVTGESAWQRRLLRWHEEPQETAARGHRASGVATLANADG